MPTYEYTCQACGKELEAEQRISEAPLSTCPTCGKDALQRMVSRSFFALKGGGWYADGYGAGGAAKDGGEASAKPDATAKSAGEGAKTETTPAEKPKTEAAPSTPAVAKPSVSD